MRIESDGLVAGPGRRWVSGFSFSPGLLPCYVLFRGNIKDSIAICNCDAQYA